jgi:glutamate-1-semialdehyde 2,1-aminomutase
MDPITLSVVGTAVGIELLRRGRRRLELSKAKHPSLRGHARIARFVSRLVPFYEYGEADLFRVDGAPPDVEARRRAAFERLGERLRARAPRTLERSAELAASVSDVAFVNAYRVPFQFRGAVRAKLPLGSLLEESQGARVRDLDGNWAYDLSGSYGVNVFGYDFYKGCIERGAARARALGPVLGAYHPLITDNARRLRAISGLDEVSFHMSGTEAVMQAVRLARYHTRRSHVVRFCGAYHGWWDGVQAGVGNPRPSREVYTLKEMDRATLRVLSTRRDVACVLVNPIQAMHPNGNAPSDSMLVTGARTVAYDRQKYAAWLRELREVCTRRGIVLILDEVFLGFRLARGGAQEYFGVRADLVTWGKTLAGGLPIGVVCGRRDLMRRFRDERPSDVCFARGTFNSHPYVMATMSEFLDHLDDPEVAAGYREVDALWEGRARDLNGQLERLGLPVRVAAMTSVWATLYTIPGRYHWLFQYYLRAHGIAMSWVGTGRFIFNHAFTDADFDEVARRFVAAAREMAADGWWWQDAALTHRSIQRRVLREMVAARFGLRSAVRGHVGHRVEQLAARDLERRPPVERDVVEGIGEDLGAPDQAGLEVPGGGEPRGAREHGGRAEQQPRDGEVAQEEVVADAAGEQAEERGLHPQHQR